MYQLHGFDGHLIGIGLQIGRLHLGGPCVQQLPGNDGFMIFVQQLDGDRAALHAARFISFLEIIGLAPFLVVIEVAFESAALEGDVAELGEAGLFALVVFLTVAFAVFDHFGFKIQTAYFGKSDPEFIAPFHLEMKFWYWVFAFSCHFD